MCNDIYVFFLFSKALCALFVKWLRAKKLFGARFSGPWLGSYQQLAWWPQQLCTYARVRVLFRAYDSRHACLASAIIVFIRLCYCLSSFVGYLAPICGILRLTRFQGVDRHFWPVVGGVHWCLVAGLNAPSTCGFKFPWFGRMTIPLPKPQSYVLLCGPYHICVIGILLELCETPNHFMLTVSTLGCYKSDQVSWIQSYVAHDSSVSYSHLICIRKFHDLILEVHYISVSSFLEPNNNRICSHDICGCTSGSSFVVAQLAKQHFKNRCSFPWFVRGYGTVDSTCATQLRKPGSPVWWFASCTHAYRVEEM